MKKLFLAAPKKLLLATSILAMSSTAIADTVQTELDATKTAALTVAAHYVTPIAVILNLATIDFGDVYTDSAVADQAVIATVTGTQDETFTYSVATSGSVVTIDTLAATLTNVAFTLGTVDVTFNVGLNTANLTADTDVAETVTISVTYDSIDSTVGTTTPV